MVQDSADPASWLNITRQTARICPLRLTLPRLRSAEKHLSGIAQRLSIHIAAGVLSLAMLSLAELMTPAAAIAAEPLPAPAGKVLLKIRGNVTLPNVGDEVHFDREAIDTLPSHGFETRTPWDDGVQSFEGVLLRDVLDAAGAESAEFEAIGSDDYRARFANIDIESNAVLLATRQNGRNLTLRTLGPLRIVFPFDDNPDFYSQGNMAAAVWQIVAMDIE